MASLFSTRRVLSATLFFAAAAFVTGCDQAPVGHAHPATKNKGPESSARDAVVAVLNDYVGSHEPNLQTQVDPSGGRAAFKAAIANNQPISSGAIICRPDLYRIYNATETNPGAALYWVRWAFYQGIVQHETLTDRTWDNATWTQDCAFVVPQLWNDRRIFRPSSGFELGVILATSSVADILVFNPYQAQVPGLGTVDGYYVEFTVNEHPAWAGYQLTPQILQANAHVVFRPDTNQYQILDISFPQPQITLQRQE
ncbi:MAG TPA: hypothetical protein VHW02_11515 [Rhizomicrobium sp.]|jgi:hypothetical protein|nr:hypothetical protein [Rhizomicrobium sp.]